MKPTIAGAILLILWIVGMLLWGNSKNIVPDLNTDIREEPCKTFGHPLWQDC